MEKKEFVENELLALLTAIDKDIYGAFYKKFDNGEEYVYINIISHMSSKNYDTEIICVTADSLSALTTDVINYLF